MEYRLELTEMNSGEKLIFPLHSSRKNNSSDIIIFDDRKYLFKLYCNDIPFSTEILYINGKNYFVNDLHTRSCPSFEGYFGWVQISIPMNDDILFSPFIQVDTYDTDTYNNVKKMIQYISARIKNSIWENSFDILGFDESNNHKNFTTESLIQGIIECYEANYKYFFTNSRTRITAEKTIDSFEKIKNISLETLKHICTHPEQLIKSTKGIKYQGKNYIPQKTLINTNGFSFDIYENQVVLGFLKHISNWLKRRDYIQKDNHFCFEDCFLEAFSKEETHSSLTQQQIETFSKHIDSLYEKYTRIFGKIQNINIASLPQMTHVFKNIMHYKKIYKYIKLWFRGGAINISEKDSVMWKLMTSSKIYEYYVLLKTDESIKNSHFVLLENETNFPDLLCYEKGKERKYLYYQPRIIFNGSYDDDKGIHLRRNTITSLSGFDSNMPYTPDYIIKSIDMNNNEVYEIVDAKFSKFSTVRDYHRPQVAFKYLLSVHAINDAKINGLKLYYCKDTEATWYDPTLKDPYIEIASLL